ncbi:hypothetical protein CcCBS67573_g08541 [Chytriomyces confervae]|uniref:Cyclic nucleotide-binding domain-containing protein n=1 Tax=Chytriomyces confervae TaxID=246404 RepID=A0A507EI83_9FUNG|nr:hypothetical protein CcCBS67573_g08541 [Chytriomyces confervae]
MNSDDLNQFATDFRRLRAEMIERSNQILSLFEAALKRCAVVQISNEQFKYQDFGIRITEGDYMSSFESSYPASQVALFSEVEKRPMAKSLGASQATNLNNASLAPVLSHAKSKNLLDPLKRSLTDAKRPLVRNPSKVIHKESKETGARSSTGRRESAERKLRLSAGQRESVESKKRGSLPQEPEKSSAKQLEVVDTPFQKLQVIETPKLLISNALNLLKPQLSMVSEGNSSTSSFSAAALPPQDLPPELAVPVTQVLHLNAKESFKVIIDTYPSSSEHGSRPAPANCITIEFNDMVIPRVLHSKSSSLDANTSKESILESCAASSPLISSTPKTELWRQPSFRQSLSRIRAPSITYQIPTASFPKRCSEDIQKKGTQFSLVTSEIQSIRPPSNKPEDPKIEPPNFFAYLFLFPAYDHKGRRITVESLAAFGKINPVFYVNGIHPRSLFSNMWDLTLGVVMSVLMWLIPFVAAFNPTYQICDIKLLAISISVVFLCDSIVSLMTPQLVSPDYSFDLSEYEKARPTLSVWLNHWLKSKFFINLLAVIPFTIFFKNEMHCEFILFISLLRCSKLWRHFYQCPTMTYAAWRLDSLTGISASRTLPLTCGIFWFIHCNSCAIYIMGRLSGFVGWDPMWPLFDSASLFETYVWTYYKYAIFLGAISSAVMAMNPSGRLFDQKVGELRDYIRSKDLSKETEARLLTYYETRYRGKYFEEDALLSDLNDSLKAEVLLQNTRKLIVNVPFLKRTAGDGRDDLFIGRIAAALRSINFIPGDYVTKQGDSGSDMYFILSGKAEVYVNERHAVTLGAGAYFGEVGLITKTLRTATVQAVMPSLMYRLTYGDFHNILSDFTDMRLRMNMLAEEREKVVKLEELSRQ